MILQPRFYKKARRGLSNLLFGEEDQSLLRSGKADPVVTDDEPTKVDEQLDDARQGYLQSLSNQKVKDISRFLADDPEKPEFDEERNKNLKNLSKVNAIASFVDALSQAIPRATSDASDRPTTVTPRSNQLGMNALDLLMQQDVNYSKQMDQFLQNLRQTKQFNKQMRFENETRNKQIDTQRASAELDIAANEQALLAAQEEIKREENKSDEEAWEELAFRMASNGQPEAAVQAMVSSGKDEKQARAIVEKMRKGKGDGTGDDSDITPQQLNMARRYKKLRDQIDSQGAAGMHYGADGKPMSAAAKEAERIQEMLGENLYSDEVMEILEGQEQGRGGEDLIAPQNRGLNELDPEAFREGMSSPESIAHQNRELVQKIQNASSDTEAKRALASWVDSMRKQGFNEQEIRAGYLKLMNSQQKAKSESDAPVQDQNETRDAGLNSSSARKGFDRRSVLEEVRNREKSPEQIQKEQEFEQRQQARDEAKEEIENLKQAAFNQANRNNFQIDEEQVAEYQRMIEELAQEHNIKVLPDEVKKHIERMKRLLRKGDRRR